MKMRCGWETRAEKRSAYICTDGLSVDVVSRAFKRGQFVDRFGNRRQITSRNMVKYGID